MGFYYGGGKEPPPGSWRETFSIIWIVFRTLALPLAVIFGSVAALFLLIWLFTIHPLAGGAFILAGLLALAAFAWWEWRHPPRLDDQVR